jgi:hypothetical protein
LLVTHRLATLRPADYIHIVGFQSVTRQTRPDSDQSLQGVRTRSSFLVFMSASQRELVIGFFYVQTRGKLPRTSVTAGAAPTFCP